MGQACTHNADKHQFVSSRYRVYSELRSRRWIGIDLGTSYSSVAVYRNKKVVVIPVDGARRVPSVVSYNDKGPLVGLVAEKSGRINPANTISSLTRLIGRKYNDDSVQKGLKEWPFKVIGGEHGEALIEVVCGGQVEVVRPEEAMAAILKKLKKAAEEFLGYQVNGAVVTISAYCDLSQQQAIHDAGEIAGLPVLRLVNQVSAAGLAYAFDNRGDPREKKVVVFGLGGGTINVFLLSVMGGIVEVRASAGDPHLGGEDLDDRLVDYCVKEFARRHQCDLRAQDECAARLLRILCKWAKRTLSTAKATRVQVTVGEVDFGVKITRRCFEVLNADYFRRCLMLAQKVLDDSRTAVGAIDDVILVGGSARIPKIREVIAKFFHVKGPIQCISPEDASVKGAAVQAGILTNSVLDRVLDCLLVDGDLRSAQCVEVHNDIISTMAERLPSKLSMTGMGTWAMQDIVTNTSTTTTATATTNITASATATFTATSTTTAHSTSGGGTPTGARSPAGASSTNAFCAKGSIPCRLQQQRTSETIFGSSTIAREGCFRSTRLSSYPHYPRINASPSYYH